MIIREGQYQDVMPYNRLAREFLDNSIYKDVGVKDGDLRQQFIRAVTGKDSLVLVAYEGKEMVGVMLAKVSVSTWGVKTAFDQFTYANRHGILDKLIKRYIRWAEGKGAKMISMANTNGVNDRFDKLIKACGLPRMGSTFVRIG